MEIVDILKLPKIQRQRIPVKTLAEQLQPTSSDKKLLEQHIESMYLISLLNEQTIRIRSYVDENYSFQAIYVFEVNLKKEDSLTQLSQLIHSAFPESSLLVLKKGDNHYLSGAIKRINKNDIKKTVIEDLVYTKIKDIQDVNIIDLQGYNLKEYYTAIFEYIYKLKVCLITNVFPKGNHNYKEVLKKYDALVANINRLKEEYKKATMRAEKLRIDDELFDQEIELKQLIKKLKGGF